MKKINKNKIAFFSIKNLLSNIIATIMAASLVVASATTLFIYHKIVYLRDGMNTVTLAILLAIAILFLHFALVGFKGLSRGWFDY